MSLFRRVMENLARPPEEIRAENLRDWAATIARTKRIAEVQPRQRERVAGVVTNIRIDPREGHGSIEATIVDGTGSMVAKWLGRSKLAGIRLGSGLLIEGLAGKQDGDLVVLNPEYELIPGPEHG